TPTPPAPDDRAPPDRRSSPLASPADAAPAAATAASPDPALPAHTAPANPQKARSRAAPTGSPTNHSPMRRNNTISTRRNPFSRTKCAKDSHSLRSAQRARLEARTAAPRSSFRASDNFLTASFAGVTRR